MSQVNPLDKEKSIGYWVGQFDQGLPSMAGPCLKFLFA